jgi:hypothetical protein
MARKGGSAADRSDFVELEGEVRIRREKAILFYDGRREAWLPLSQIEMADDGKSILCPEWLALDKGLI